MPTLFEISVTAILRRDGKFLITKRSPTKKRFPNLWTVPGGHLEEADFDTVPPNKDGVWYGVLESAVRREVKEETGLDITNIRYCTSMALDKGNVVVVSLIADAPAGDVILDSKEAVDYEWVTLEDAPDFRLIDGILDELRMAADQ